MNPFGDDYTSLSIEDLLDKNKELTQKLYAIDSSSPIYDQLVNMRDMVMLEYNERLQIQAMERRVRCRLRRRSGHAIDRATRPGSDPSAEGSGRRRLGRRRDAGAGRRHFALCDDRDAWLTTRAVCSRTRARPLHSAPRPARCDEAPSSFSAAPV